MKVVDGFRERAENVESVTDDLLLKLGQVWLRGIDERRSEGGQVGEGTRESTLGSSDGSSDLLRECYEERTGSY